ncbi:dim gamma-tubulin 6 [Haematobia irritans]|uniref:dim gamma-tubulin 6 n=1 Tax=Haematobia irritans TaxID=7368 RepID=UPI003F504C99
MDRTIIAPYRAEEKELSIILYNKLQGLALLHAPSEELKKCMSDDMFTKPNQHAFFHVMHYLFRIIDPNEFRKRFYWPITDKRSESNFRSSTVEYLKYLNEKHQLNWTNIKSYLVVMPGGMKFISFLLDLLHFVIQELIKQKEKQLNVDSAQYVGMVTQENLRMLCRKDTCLKEMASTWLESVDLIGKRYNGKIQMLTHLLSELADKTSLPTYLLVDDKFLSDFEDSNEELIERNFRERTRKIKEMEQHVFEMKESMDSFYAKGSEFKCDEQKITQQLRIIRDNFADDLSEASIMNNEGVNVNTLIKAFNSISSTLQAELSVANKRPQAGLVKTRLTDVQKDLQQVEKQITDFLLVIKSRKKKRENDVTQTPIRRQVHAGIETKHGIENTLLLKYVSTPPIKLEMQDGQHGPSRLSLIDTKTSNSSNAFNSFLVPSRTTTRPNRLNNSLAEQSMTDLNATMNRSKLIDPMQLLRSINKDSSKTTPKANLSALGGRWKERQSLLADKCDDIPSIIVTGAESPYTQAKPAICTDDGRTTPVSRKSLFSEKEGDISNTSTVAKRSFATSSGSPTLIQSPFTPFNSNERTRISRPQIQLWDTNSFTGSTYSPSTSWSGVKKMCALKKVQDASLNYTNLSTSPSGRLEPLVTVEDFDIPKLKLNDNSLIDQSITLNNSYAKEDSNQQSVAAVQLNISEANNENEFTTTVFDNNNTKSVGRQDENIQGEEDALFNISDSVLKDVTM